MKDFIDGQKRTLGRPNTLSLEEKIQRLQDRIDILESMYDYCRHADLMDADGMAAYFTDDCVVSYVQGTDEYTFHGRKKLHEFLAAHSDSTISGSHHICNEQLLFETADSVVTYFYMYSWQRFNGYPVTADCHRWGRYEGRFIRLDEEWRISQLRLLSAGEYGGARIGEQFNRPWPPQFE